MRLNFYRTNDISDIEASIKYSRLSLDATRSSDLWRHNPLASLRNILFFAFEKTNKISYLDESITLGYDILELRSAQPFHFHVVQVLVDLYSPARSCLGEERTATKPYD
jgi:hypothetical protein